MVLPPGGFAQRGNEVIEYHTTVKVDRGRVITERSYLIQVNDKQSDWIGDIEIVYSNGNEPEILEAAVIDASGNSVRKLKKKEISSSSYTSSGTFYEDNSIISFALKWHKYPYRIKYSYRTIVDQYLNIVHWYPSVYSHVPTRKASLKVELPPNYEAFIDYSDEFNYQVETVANGSLHTWELSNISPVEQELFSPPYQERLPQVNIVPEEFYYGREGSFSSWPDYGLWQEQLNEGLDVLPEGEKIKVDRLISGVTDRNELVKKLYHYMQDNTGISMYLSTSEV